MKLLHHLLLIPLCLLLFACEKQDERACGDEGSLRVAVSLQGFSRAETPGDGSIYDGGGMEDLTLVVVDPNGTIAAIQQVTALSGEEQRVKEVLFEHLDIGHHTLYAYANIERSYLTEGKSLLSSLVVGESFGATRRDALFTALTDTAAPETSATEPLLLTGVEQVAIDVGVTSCSIVLVRPVARFEVRLHNHAEVAMTVTDLSTSAFNPSTGYLLPHGGVLPASLTYRNLPSYDSYTGGEDLVVAAGAEQVIYRTELFENRAPSYTLDLGLSITTEVTSTQPVAVTTLVANTPYLLKNRSTGNYLVDNGGEMALVASLAEAASTAHAQWRFSDTEEGYLTNEATGNRYYRSTASSNSGSNLTFTKSGNYYRITSNGYRYLRDDNGSVEYAYTSGNTRDWQLQELNTSTTQATIQRSVEGLELQVVDPVTAAVVAMSEQLRNQYIKVTINAYYNDQLGSFNFEVAPWTEKNEEVEFN